MTLPELHGWLPAAALARREGVTPSTIRRRGARGQLDTIPNPLGPGALYRLRGADPSERSPDDAPGFVSVCLPVSVPVRVVSGGDRLALGVLPASVTSIARHLGLSKGAAEKALARLEAAGLARRAEEMPSGPRGGRPAIVWRSAR